MKKTVSLLTVIAMMMASPVAFAQPTTVASPISPQPGAIQVGVVAAVTGKVELTPSGKQVGHLINSGQKIYKGDIVSTDDKSTIQLLLLDETVFTIGPSSKMAIDEYVFNPSNDDGKIAARAIDGTFRYITGRVPTKKPSNMEIQLPTGVMAVRGTIVYLIVDEAKKSATGILAGPGGDHNTKHRTGSFVMKNEVRNKNGDVEVKETFVSRPGKASTIGGEGQAPSGSFTFPKADYAALQSQFENEIVMDTDEQGHGEDGNAEGGGESATEMAGQDIAEGLDDLDDLEGFDDMYEDYENIIDGANDDTNDGGDEGDIPDGLAIFKDFVFQTGQYHYEASGDFSGLGSWTFKMNIDFGAGTVGGGQSEFSGDAGWVTPNTNSNFIFSLDTQGFGDLNDAASFSFHGFDASCGRNGGGCDGNITVDLFNAGGEAGAFASGNAEVYDNYNMQDATTDFDAERQSGSA